MILREIFFGLFIAIVFIGGLLVGHDTCACGPKQASEKTYNNSENSNNGVAVPIHKMPNTSNLASERDIEQGMTFFRGIICIILFCIAYAVLKFFGTKYKPKNKYTRKEK